jgi:DNA-binding transcriptional LysR family regulator
MDFRQLNYFVAVAQELSFSRAARRLHISQPPLSNQIKLLEEDLGVLLFERTRRVVRLTHAGALFYDKALDILGRYAVARELCAWTTDGRAGKLRIAFTASVPMFDAFPRMLQSFRQQFPRVEIDVRHLSTGEQLRALSQNEIDIGFLRPSSTFQPSASVSARDLWHDELVLALPHTHKEAQNESATPLAALAKDGFILFPQALGCGLFEHITTLAAQAGFSPRIVQEARENSTTLALVAAGFGVSVVPSVYGRSHFPGVVFKRMSDEATASRIVFATPADGHNPSLALFTKHAEAFASPVTIDFLTERHRESEAIAS